MPEDPKYLSSICTVIIPAIGYVYRRLRVDDSGALIFDTLKGRKKALPCCCSYRSSCCVGYKTIEDPRASPECTEVQVRPPQDEPGCFYIPKPDGVGWDRCCISYGVVYCNVWNKLEAAGELWKLVPSFTDNTNDRPIVIDTFNRCEEMLVPECSKCEDPDNRQNSGPCGKVLKYPCAHTEEGGVDDENNCNDNNGTC